MTRTIIGFDIGGTKTAIVEGSRDGQILQRVELPTQAHEPFSQNIARIVESAQQICDRAQTSSRDIIAVSISVGGPLKIQEGVLLNPPHLPGWHGVN